MSLDMQRTLFGRSLLLQACWNSEGMQNLGFAFSIEPWLKACFAGRDDEYRRALTRHGEYFNTHPYMSGLVLGLVCALEAEIAAAPEPATREALIARLKSLKTGAACALAGVGDALFWATLRPACAAGALAVGATAWMFSPKAGALAAAAAYLAAYNAPSLYLRYHGIRWGYDWREGIAVKLREIPWQAWIARLRRAGQAMAAAGFILCGLALAEAGWFAASPWFSGAAVFAASLAARNLPVSNRRIYAALCGLGMIAAWAG